MGPRRRIPDRFAIAGAGLACHHHAVSIVARRTGMMVRRGGGQSVLSFLCRCGVTLFVAFTLCPLVFVLLFGYGEGPASGLGGVLFGWVVMFVIQFRVFIFWPVPLLIGLIAAGLWQWIAKRASARRAALSRAQ
jgi:hypothetical protein